MRSDSGDASDVGVVGGEVFDPNPSAFRRAASPGEGLRGWRKEALVDDDVCLAFAGLSVSADGAEGDGFEDGVREEFSLQGSGVRNSSRLAGGGARRNQEAEDRGSGGVRRTRRRGWFWGGGHWTELEDRWKRECMQHRIHPTSIWIIIVLDPRDRIEHQQGLQGSDHGQTQFQISGTRLRKGVARKSDAPSNAVRENDSP